MQVLAFGTCSPTGRLPRDSGASLPEERRERRAELPGMNGERKQARRLSSNGRNATLDLQATRAVLTAGRTANSGVDLANKWLRPHPRGACQRRLEALTRTRTGLVT